MEFLQSLTPALGQVGRIFIIMGLAKIILAFIDSRKYEPRH